MCQMVKRKADIEEEKKETIGYNRFLLPLCHKETN